MDENEKKYKVLNDNYREKATRLLTSDNFDKYKPELLIEHVSKEHRLNFIDPALYFFTRGIDLGCTQCFQDLESFFEACKDNQCLLDYCKYRCERFSSATSVVSNHLKEAKVNQIKHDLDKLLILLGTRCTGATMPKFIEEVIDLTYWTGDYRFKNSTHVIYRGIRGERPYYEQDDERIREMTRCIILVGDGSRITLDQYRLYNQTLYQEELRKVQKIKSFLLLGTTDALNDDNGHHYEFALHQDLLNIVCAYLPWFRSVHLKIEIGPHSNKLRLTEAKVVQLQNRDVEKSEEEWSEDESTSDDDNNYDDID